MKITETNNNKAIPFLMVKKGGSDYFSQWISGREIYEFISFPRGYTEWLDSCRQKGGFLPFKDFVCIDQIGLDHELSLEFALSLALDVNNPTAHEAAKYIYEKLIKTLRDAESEAVSQTDSGSLQNEDIPVPESKMTLDFGGQPLQVIMRNGDPWFIAKEVCDAIGLTNSRVAVKALDAEDRITVNISYSIPTKGPQSQTYISESGLYSLTLRCHDSLKPGTAAYTFRRWVTHEVLPAIHKNGRYEAPNHGTIQKQVKAAHWIYDGGFEEVKTHVPKCSPLEGGYIVLFESTDGGIRIGSVNDPYKYITEENRIMTRAGCKVVRVAISNPCHNYIKLKKKLIASIKDGRIEGGCYRDVTITQIKQLVEELLEKELPPANH